MEAATAEPECNAKVCCASEEASYIRARDFQKSHRRAGMPSPQCRSCIPAESQMRGRTRLGSAVTHSLAGYNQSVWLQAQLAQCADFLSASVWPRLRDGVGSLALETILARTPSKKTYGSNFLLVPTHPTAIRVELSASLRQTRWKYIFTTGHDMAHILSSCPLGGGQMPVWYGNLFVCSAPPVVHTDRGRGSRPTKEEASWVILSPRMS